jgi:hypothetical protein
MHLLSSGVVIRASLLQEQYYCRIPFITDTPNRETKPGGATAWDWPRVHGFVRVGTADIAIFGANIEETVSTFASQ